MSSIGKVYLVGGGPGDPGLLTLRGLECLSQADLVLYDGLVNPWLLRHTRAECQRTARVTVEGRRSLDQEQINRRLVEAALQGMTVVRLKGGDPFVFGRGSEEAHALRQAGIPFEVVPGITAAVAASAYAGISLTHRDLASGVAFITGHEVPDKPESFLDYQRLADFPGTLVFYMGLHRLAEISHALIEAGKPGETPTAVISRGTTPLQRTVTGPLNQISELVRSAGLEPPSLIVVGECVQLRDELTWFEHRPLFGMTIAITRAEEQMDDVAHRIQELGARPVALPTIALQPPESLAEVDRVLGELSTYDWIVFTSSNGIRFFLERLWEMGGDVRRFGTARIAAIGAQTAQTLEKYHLRADLVPDQFRAEELARALVPQVAGKRVLWVRANRGRDVLPRELRGAGAELQEVIAYRHVDLTAWPAEEMRLIERGELNWLPLSSPAIAAQVARLLPETISLTDPTRTLRFVSISPVTTAAARSAGLPVDAEAETYTWEGMLQSIQRYHLSQNSTQDAGSPT